MLSLFFNLLAFCNTLVESILILVFTVLHNHCGTTGGFPDHHPNQDSNLKPIQWFAFAALFNCHFNF